MSGLECSECGADVDWAEAGCDVCGRLVCPKHHVDGRCPSCPAAPQYPISSSHVSVDKDGQLTAHAGRYTGVVMKPGKAANGDVVPAEVIREAAERFKARVCEFRIGYSDGPQATTCLKEPEPGNRFCATHREDKLRWCTCARFDGCLRDRQLTRQLSTPFEIMGACRAKAGWPKENKDEDHQG